MGTERRRERLRRLALFALILAVQFAVFEVALRTWGSSEAAPAFQGLFENDPVVGYRLKPGADVRFATAEFDTEIRINSAGVRDDDEIGEKAPNERRILILGDSLVLSVQVPFGQTFGELLEQRLNSRGSPVHYRVINGGVQGYGPVQELLFLRSLLPVVKPDLVLETLFVGNDIEDAVGARAAARTAAAPDDGYGPRGDDHAASADRAAQHGPAGAPPARAGRDGTLYAHGRTARAAAAKLCGATRRRESAAACRSFTASCSRCSRKRSAAGARTAVVLMPARFQVNDDDYGHLRDAVTQSGGTLVRDAAGERIDEALRDIPVPRFDVLPPLRAAGPDVFFLQTVHLTPRGHEIVAEALDRFLRESRLLDGF